ncbi:hypothetical protein IJV79_04560 [bacterium]|nr:hypothetical protein [bacterium]
MAENELVKKLCSKNDFETAAASIINNADVDAFTALVEKSDSLFDFVKRNVIQRLQSKINEHNYLNLLKFLTVYSYDYEDLLVSALKKYFNETLESKILEILKSGTDPEKAYCVKIIQNPQLITEDLRKFATSEFDPLAYNSAQVLGVLKDETSFNNALKELESDDDFKILSAVKFLIAYNDKRALPALFNVLKTSSMAENIACEIVYLEDVFTLLKEYPNDTLLLINHIINGLGEVIPLSIVFDIQLYELIEHLSSPVTILNLKLKIEQLTENDEYLFDEDKSVKEEILAIKELLNSKTYYDELCENLTLNDNLVFFTLQVINELGLDYSDEIVSLIKESTNETLILKCVEVLSTLRQLCKLSQGAVLEKVQDVNIKAIIAHYFSLTN